MSQGKIWVADKPPVKLSVMEHEGFSLPSLTTDQLVEALSENQEQETAIRQGIDNDKGLFYAPLEYNLQPKPEKSASRPALHGNGGNNMFSAFIKSEEHGGWLLHNTFDTLHTFVQLAPSAEGNWAIKRMVTRGDVLTDHFYATGQWFEVVADFEKNTTAISAISAVDEFCEGMRDLASTIKGEPLPDNLQKASLNHLDAYHGKGRLSRDAYNLLTVYDTIIDAWKYRDMYESLGKNPVGEILEAGSFKLFRMAQNIAKGDTGIIENLTEMLKTEPGKASSMISYVNLCSSLAIAQPAMHYKLGCFRQPTASPVVPA